MRAHLVLASLLAAAGMARADGIAPHASWPLLAWSNGHGAGAYDTTRARMTSLKEHLYDHTADGTRTRELMYDAYPGLRVGGQNLWLTSRPVESAGYDDGRGIARVVQTWQGVRVTAYYYAPFGVDAPLTVAIFEVENTGTAALSDAALFALDNVHVGGGDGTEAEHLAWISGAYEERGAAGLALHRPSPAPAVHGATPQNPYQAVVNGGHMTSVDDSGTQNDAAAGFEWNLTGLAPGATKRFELVLAFAADGNRAALDAKLASIPADPANALAAARDSWELWFASGVTPLTGLSPDEAAVAKQQLAFLRMGQVRNDGPGSGQIVASLPTGIWNISWVRDASYAIMALVRTGHYPEAKAALAFWWENAHVGQFASAAYVGAPYQISVVRYTGDGVEESDSDANGPNVELDGFGLALEATRQYAVAANDIDFIRDHAAAIFARDADVLVSLLEPSGANAGLVKPDSSIWETHWTNGGRKHFAYTQATTYLGLRAASGLSALQGDLVDNYDAAWHALASAFRARFTQPSGALVGNLEEPPASALDLAAIEALNWDLVSPAGASAIETLNTLRAGLWNSESGHGYHRNDDGGEYDRREWIVMDLRVSTALRRAGRPDEAQQLVDWVTDQARMNFDIIPENYDAATGDYLGAIPMVGFGAGAYLLALADRESGAGVDNPVPDGGAQGPSEGGNDVHGGGDGGCCGTTSSPASALLLALATTASLRRRARPRRC